MCPSCESQIFNRQLERNLRVCPTCGHHFRMGIGQRIELLLDDGSFVEHDAGLESGDPLGFHDQKPYVDRLEASRVKTGLREAAVWGIGTIDGQRVAIGLFDFHFMGGSMGSVVGEKLARCFEAALPSGSRPSWSAPPAGRACRRAPCRCCSSPRRPLR